MTRVLKCTGCQTERGQQPQFWPVLSVNVPDHKGPEESQAGVALCALMRRWCLESPGAHAACPFCSSEQAPTQHALLEGYRIDSFGDVVAICVQRFVNEFVDNVLCWRKKHTKIVCPYYMKMHESMYELVGAVGHTGEQPNMGHYRAQVRNQKDGCWYICDDSTVSKLSDPAVGKGTFTSLAGGDLPYILFYRKAGAGPPEAPLVQGDSPETAATRKALHTTPKRQQTFAPRNCKMCGVNDCGGACVQCF